MSPTVHIAVESSTAFIAFFISRLVHIFPFANGIILEETIEEVGVRRCGGLLLLFFLEFTQAMAYNQYYIIQEHNITTFLPNQGTTSK